MVGNLIVRGLIVGIVAGLLAFGFAKVFGEPYVDAGIAFEEQQAAAAGQPTEPEIVSRPIQSGFALMSGLVILGAGLGAVFSILFAFAYGRIGNFGAQQTSALLGFLCWVAIFFVPFLKYPSNPPGANEPETIAFRTSTYFLILAISVAATIGAWLLRQRLLQQYGSWYASLMASGAFVVVIAAFNLILPSVNETPEGFPAAALYDFRLASLGIWVVLWGTIGLLFGTVVEKTMEGFGARPAMRQGAMMTR